MNYLKPILIITAALLISLGCDRKDNDMPENLLTENEMIGVLTDIHMAESALTQKNFNRDTAVFLFSIYEEEIFKNRHTTKQQFKDSYDYYSKHSVEIDRIYAIVVDSLKEKEIKAGNEVSKDSVRH